MLIVALFGIGMFLLGGVMLLSPMSFANGIITFSNQPWFHGFEFISRLIVGLLLVFFADSTDYPLLVFGLGILLCAVSLFLLLLGSHRHKQFALLTARIGKRFRPLGGIAMVCGSILVYLSLN